MLNLRYENVNPKHRKTGDCTTRALCKTLGFEYDEVLRMQFEMALKTKYDTSSKQVTERILKEYGWVKMPQPRKANGKKYRVWEMDELLTKKQMQEGVLISVANHNTCIKDGAVIDIWDCTDYTVGNYYVKER